MKWLIIAAITAAGLIFAGDKAKEAVEEAKEPQAVVMVDQDGALTDFSGAIRFVGVCGVVCSLIWGTSIVVVSRNRKRRAEP